MWTGPYCFVIHALTTKKVRSSSAPSVKHLWWLLLLPAGNVYRPPIDNDNLIHSTHVRVSCVLGTDVNDLLPNLEHLPSGTSTVPRVLPLCAGARNMQTKTNQALLGICSFSSAFRPRVCVILATKLFSKSVHIFHSGRPNLSMQIRKLKALILIDEEERIA
jgi:hypothetical protein